ncbi:F0F1 ATP synthase subunit gamma [Methylomonas sp. MgM2]
MSQRREIEAQLILYDELSGILGAMRSFALAELRRVGKREVAQQRVVASLKTALDDFGSAVSAFNSTPVSQSDEIWLLFGSVRGFCGGFNEDIVRFWKSGIDPRAPLIIVGERLHDMIRSDVPIQRLSGADGALNAPNVIDDILNAVTSIRANGNGCFGLNACVRDEHGVRSQRLWPPPSASGPDGGYPPLTYAPADEVAAGIAEHFLFHSLLELLFRSIKVENHMRLMQMENALRHIERGSDELHRQRNRLRQEEIVEEIELMIGSRHSR